MPPFLNQDSQRAYPITEIGAMLGPNKVALYMLLAITGATGFIGQYLLREMPKRGYRVRALLRRPASVPMLTAGAVIGDLARPQNMSAALEGVDAVIHSAGLAHGMSGIPEDDYRLLNTEATIGLARAAWRAGAKRFVFLSSIRAQCGPTADSVLTEAAEPRPTDAYGRSKLAAERGLAELDLEAAEIDRLGREIGEILAYAEQVQRVDTTGVPPTAGATAGLTGDRADRLAPSLDPSVALANAPEPFLEGGLFKVPRVIGS